MGDAAYERAATADEIEPHVPRSCARRIDAGARRLLDQLLVRAPRRRRQARPEPLRRRATRSRRCSAPRARRARAWCSSRRASSAATPTSTSGSRSIGRPFTYPLFARAGRHAPRAGRAARGGPRATAPRCGRRSRRGRSRCSSRWPTPYSLNTGTVFGELLQGEPRRRGSPRTAIPTWRARAAADLEQSPMKPRWETFEVSESERFPELRGPAGQRPRRASAACGPLDVMCELAVAEDLETRFRAYIANDDVDAVGAPAHARPRGARPLRRRRARRPAVRRAAAHRPARHVGARARASCRSSRRCAS